MAWAKNGTPSTLGGTASQITISDLTSTNFNVILNHNFTSGNINNLIRLDNTSGSNYARRSSEGGASDATETSQTSWNLTDSVGSNDTFDIMYIVNISGEEKLAIGFWLRANPGGAPQVMELALKYDVTSGQYSRIDVIEDQAGSFAAGSNLSALTGDETETATLQNGTIFEESDTNKAYIWNSSTNTWTQL